MTSVDWTDLVTAFEWASAGGEGDNAAFIDSTTGAVFCTGDDIEPEEAIPEDLETSDRYLAIPTKVDLDLGKRLALSFVGEQLPDDFDRVSNFFRKAGAYSRFKDLLADRGKLDVWYAFEQAARQRALHAWCSDNGIEPTGAPDA